MQIIQQTNQVAANLGLPLVHETHRGRALYSVPATLAILEAIPTLRINADLAHYCVVHQSYLQDQLESLNRVLERSYYIHARVAYPEGSQVSDPRAPEWQPAVDYHIQWWQQIVAARKQENFDPWQWFCGRHGGVAAGGEDAQRGCGDYIDQCQRSTCRADANAPARHGSNAQNPSHFPLVAQSGGAICARQGDGHPT